MNAGGWVPLMLQPGWILERHLGWACLEEGPALKILARRRGAVRTFLLLTRGAAADVVARAARRHGALGPLALATWVEFEAAPEGQAPTSIELDGRAFAPVDHGRVFGVGTFLVDLAQDEPALWSRVSARERGKARQAERAGVRVVTQARPGPADLDGLVRLYAPMARARGLEPLDANVLAAMARDGALRLARAADAQGRTLVVNVAWVARGQGYFLHGARAADVPPGAGLLAQWELLRALKAEGCRDYDLGLVATTDESDGIYRFKRALGGAFVRWGAEYRRTPPWLRRPYAAFQRLRARARTPGA